MREPTTNKVWDLGFRRYEIKSNGGFSGKSGVKIAILKETEFDSVQTPPKDGYRTDNEDEDGDGVPDYVFLQEGNWYNYDLGKHLLNPKPRVYVIRATDGAHYKLRMYSYYSNKNKSGTPSFTWQRLE